MNKSQCISKIQAEISHYEYLHLLFDSKGENLNPVAAEHMDFLRSILNILLSKKETKTDKKHRKQLSLFSESEMV